MKKNGAIRYDSDEFYMNLPNCEQLDKLKGGIQRSASVRHMASLTDRAKSKNWFTSHLISGQNLLSEAGFSV